MKFSTIHDKILIVRHENKSQLLAKIAIKTHIKHVTSVTKRFWKRFCKRYLLSLREKHYHKNNINEKRELKTNDVVLIQDGKITPRNNWRKRK